MRNAIVALLVAVSVSATAGTLDHPSEIDLTYVDQQSGQLELFVILDEPVSTRQSIRALYKKLRSYRSYVATGLAFKDHPAANSKRKPVVTIMAPREADSAEMQNLEGVRLRLANQGYKVAIRPYDRNVKPSPRVSGRADR